MRPMLATATDQPPAGREWIHEVKWDGMRILATCQPDGTRLSTRNELDATARFPELPDLCLPGTVLDGEIVALEAGVPSFAALAERIHITDPALAARAASRRAVSVMVFDVLAHRGESLLERPWSQRRELLEGLELPQRWVLPPTYDDGHALLEATASTGLEGVVSKLITSGYTPGKRSPYWLKRPHRLVRSVVVGGWRPESGSAAGRSGSSPRLGSVLVGVPSPQGLHLLGRVGSGLAGKAGPPLRAALKPLEQQHCPFLEVPREDAATTIWVRPELIIDVASLGLAGNGRLRQPSYQGMRPDLDPHDILPAS
ncbi:ATP-dependent DNA ligase [Gephyromycinifex aptenodytis]|uniref:ATP-dependent DNA ligase n=1 Tax=Gephyromycinifex aptenodytis TaxID=2716227 RepID=UPI00144526B6|nr:DNA ligase [Gephyromycinifex aptenodytis]